MVPPGPALWYRVYTSLITVFQPVRPKVLAEAVAPKSTSVTVPTMGAVEAVWVVAEAEADCTEVLPEASYAETVYEYAVDGERPVLEYVVPAAVAI